MAQIVFNPGITWQTLPQVQVSRLIEQAWLRERLADLRAEWVEAAGDDLSQVTLDLGMLFDDIERLISGE